MNIEEKIKNLSEEEMKKFRRIFFGNLNDRDWCNDHRINYADPDIKKVREITYFEIFERYR